MAASEPKSSQEGKYLPNQGEFRFIFFTPRDRFEQTVNFYRHTLQLPTRDGYGDSSESIQGAYVQAGSGVIEIIVDRQNSDLFLSVLQPGESYQPARGGWLLIEVDDVDGLYHRLEQEKVDMIQPIRTWPWGFRDFKLKDPCGNVLCLFSRVAR